MQDFVDEEKMRQGLEKIDRSWIGCWQRLGNWWKDAYHLVVQFDLNFATNIHRWRLDRVDVFTVTDVVDRDGRCYLSTDLGPDADKIQVDRSTMRRLMQHGLVRKYTIEIAREEMLFCPNCGKDEDHTGLQFYPMDGVCRIL